MELSRFFLLFFSFPFLLKLILVQVNLVQLKVTRLSDWAKHKKTSDLAHWNVPPWLLNSMDQNNALSSELSEIHGARFQCNSHVMYHLKSQSHPLSTSFIKSNSKRLQFDSAIFMKNKQTKAKKIHLQPESQVSLFVVTKKISLETTHTSRIETKRTN